ncbi:hypothetical protein J6590_003575 [Homalodisca vitripennis]|nr:hypothetical protein J6590_003575 [Homalodisca vitripennis]
MARNRLQRVPNTKQVPGTSQSTPHSLSLATSLCEKNEKCKECHSTVALFSQALRGEASTTARPAINYIISVRFLCRAEAYRHISLRPPQNVFFRVLSGRLQGGIKLSLGRWSRLSPLEGLCDLPPT